MSPFPGEEEEAEGSRGRRIAGNNRKEEARVEKHRDGGLRQRLLRVKASPPQRSLTLRVALTDKGKKSTESPRTRNIVFSYHNR